MARNLFINSLKLKGDTLITDEHLMLMIFIVAITKTLKQKLAKFD